MTEFGSIQLTRENPGNQPLREIFFFDLASSDPKNHIFHDVNLFDYFVAIDQQKHLHGQKTSTLVTIKKRVVQDDRKAENGSFFGQSRVKLDISEALLRQCHCGFKTTFFTNAVDTARLLQAASVNQQQICFGKISHCYFASRRNNSSFF